MALVGIFLGRIVDDCRFYHNKQSILDLSGYFDEYPVFLLSSLRLDLGESCFMCLMIWLEHRTNSATLAVQELRPAQREQQHTHRGHQRVLSSLAQQHCQVVDVEVVEVGELGFFAEARMGMMGMVGMGDDRGRGPEKHPHYIQ